MKQRSDASHCVKISIETYCFFAFDASSKLARIRSGLNYKHARITRICSTVAHASGLIIEELTKQINIDKRHLQFSCKYEHGENNRSSSESDKGAKQSILFQSSGDSHLIKPGPSIPTRDPLSWCGNFWGTMNK